MDLNGAYSTEYHGSLGSLYSCSVAPLRADSDCLSPFLALAPFSLVTVDW